MDLHGRPDFARPLALGAGACWAAYDDPARAWVPAARLALAREADGQPAFALERLPWMAADGPRVLGLASARFAPEHALTERQALAFASGEARVLQPMAASRAFLRFDAPAGLALPEALRQPQALGPDGAGVLGLQLALAPDELRLLEEALAVGVQALDATLEWEAWGVAERAPMQASVDPPRLADWLRRRAPALERDGAVLEALAASLAVADAGDSGVAFAGPGDDEDGARQRAALALIDRLRARHGRLVAAVDPGLGAHHALDLAAFAAGRWTLDLDTPVLAPRAWVLHAQPMLALPPRPAQAAAPVRLAHGLHTIGLALNLPAARVGVLGLSIELQAPAWPPARPQAATASTRIAEGRTGAHLPLRLSPAEPLAYRWRCTALAAWEGAAPMALVGDWREAGEAQLTVPPDALPLGFARIAASPALLALGNLALRAEGRLGGAPVALRTRLDAARGAVALALPPGLEDATLHVLVQPHAGGDAVALAPLPAADAWLDLHLLPGFAPQRCVLAFDAPLAAPGHLAWIDAAHLAAGRPDAPRLQPLAAGDTEVALRWLPADPLRPAIAWRHGAAPDQTPASWSPPLPPGRHAIPAPPAARPSPPIDQDTAMDPLPLGDITALPLDAGQRHFRLLPRRPGLARTPSGQPQLQLLEVGALRLLQLTAAWGLAEDEREAARSALAARLGVAADLLRLDEPDDSVEAFELWLAGDDGRPVLAASNPGSRSGAQHAVFSLPLDEARAARVKRALAGERGLAWIRARLAAPAAAARSESSAIHDALWSRSTAIDGVAVDGATGAAHAETHASTAPAPPRPAADADAADWATPR